MKKLMYLAAALLVLVACDNQDNNVPERTPFKKGQQVTLTVGSANQGSQAPARTMSGVRNDNNIAFAWEEGDKILVKVGEATAEFTLISGEGTKNGEFAGTMPADGSTFDILYPVEVSDLSEQVYSEEKAIPADKMEFAATGCTLDNPTTLTALDAMLQLNLYGTDMTIGKIVFTPTNSLGATSLTLTCTDGKTIGASEGAATPFYMVVPAGMYQFEVEVYDNAATPAKICSFAPSADKTFVAGECLNMPAKEVKAAPTIDPKLVFSNMAQTTMVINDENDNHSFRLTFVYDTYFEKFEFENIVQPSGFKNLLSIIKNEGNKFTIKIGPTDVLTYDADVTPATLTMKHSNNANSSLESFSVCAEIAEKLVEEDIAWYINFIPYSN